MTVRDCRPVPCRQLFSGVAFSGQLSIPRVDARGKALLADDEFQQRGQLCPLIAVQGGADVVLVRGGQLPHLVQYAMAFGGQVERVMTAILGAAPPLHQALVVQVVDQSDDTAGHDSQIGGQRSLTAARLAGDHAQ